MLTNKLTIAKDLFQAMYFNECFEVVFELIGCEKADTDANLIALQCVMNLKGAKEAIELLAVLEKEYKKNDKFLPKKLSEFGISTALLQTFYTIERCNLKLNEKNLNLS